jgi:hypothetical protein
MASHDGVTIEFDQTRKLLFDFKASKALDRAMGEVGLVKVLESLQALNIAALERTLWAGLQHEDSLLTLNLISKRLEKYADSGKSLEPLFRGAIKALNDSTLFNQPEDDAGNGSRETATTA